MLFTLQRYEFFSKSQHKEPWCDSSNGCCLPYKGTNFSANHNRSRISTCALCDVVYPTKVRIFQQITTRSSGFIIKQQMLFTLQRYEFFSKSQLFLKIERECVRCCLPYKGTNFSANHNSFHQQPLPFRDVVYPTKVRIFQQITTGNTRYHFTDLMLFTLQRYEFFSKSQPSGRNWTTIPWCCLPYKGTNFSANHNADREHEIPSRDVVYPTKERIFQQITT